MMVLAPEAREQLKKWLLQLKEMRNEAKVVADKVYGEAIAYPERIGNARYWLRRLNEPVRDVEAVIKYFLYALDDQEVVDEEVGFVLQSWNFEEPDETNPPV